MTHRLRHLAAVFVWAAATSASALPPFSDRVEIRFRIDRSQPVEEVYRYLKRRAKVACRDPGMWHPLQRKRQSECISSALQQVLSVLDWDSLNQHHVRASRVKGEGLIVQTQ